MSEDLQRCRGGAVDGGRIVGGEEQRVSRRLVPHHQQVSAGDHRAVRDVAGRQPEGHRDRVALLLVQTGE
ncbi:hypothetical protein [Streptomyces canarius]